jgi:hypothetical protein
MHSEFTRIVRHNLRRTLGRKAQSLPYLLLTTALLRLILLDVDSKLDTIRWLRSKRLARKMPLRKQKAQ